MNGRMAASSMPAVDLCFKYLSTILYENGYYTDVRSRAVAEMATTAALNRFSHSNSMSPPYSTSAKIWHLLMIKKRSRRLRTSTTENVDSSPILTTKPVIMSGTL